MGENSQDQRDFLFAVKEEIGCTWDELAKLCKIAPRALTTYRLPPGSKNRRKMLPLAWAAVERARSEHRQRAGQEGRSAAP